MKTPYWSIKARAEERIHKMSLFDKLSYVYKYVWGHQFSTDDPIAVRFAKQNHLRRAETNKSHTHKGICLGFIGDIMWIRDSWKNFLTPEAKESLESVHGIVGNLETVISDDFPVKEHLPDRFVFNSPPQYLDAFQKNSTASIFTSLSLANNHTLDYFDKGALDTIKNVEEKKIAHCGVNDLSENPYATFNIEGITFAHYSAAFGMNDFERQKNSHLKIHYISKISTATTLDEIDLTSILAAIKNMKAKKINVILLSLHWGHEFEHFPKSLQREVAKKLIQAGAHFILGCHPHVFQPYEYFSVNNYDMVNMENLNCDDPEPRKALVCYSLGNFSNAMITVPCQLSLLLGITFYRTELGSIDWNGPSITLFWNHNSKKERKFKKFCFEDFQTHPKKQKKIYDYLMFLGTHLFGEPNYFLKK